MQKEKTKACLLKRGVEALSKKVTTCGHAHVGQALKSKDDHPLTLNNPFDG